MLHHHNYVNMPTTLKLAIGRGNSYKIARNLTVDKSHYSYTIVTLHPPNIYAFPPYPGPKYYQFHYDRPNNANTHTKGQREEGTWIMPSLYRPSGGPNNTPQSLPSLNVLVAKVKDFGRAQNKVGTIKDGLDYARMLRSHNGEKKNLQE